MNTPSNANTSGLAPTEALRLVPVEPTHQMHYDGDRVLANAVKNGGSIFDTTKAIWSAMLAAAPASPLPGGGWQDISTAPKDGTVVLIFTPSTFPNVTAAYYRDDIIQLEHWQAVGHRWHHTADVTHWMPLPAAPTGGLK